MTWTLLLSLLAKSSLIAGAGLLCARVMTRRPVERVDILRATVCLLLALPAIMNLLPPLELTLLPPPAVEPIPVVSTTASTAAAAPAPVSPWTSPGAMIGGLWLLGAGLVGGRLALGLRTLQRWTRKAEPVTHPAWLAPIEDLPPVDRPGLMASDRIAGPLSWGVAPGTILLDPATLAEPHTAPAIMAHELAHLRRHDWIFLILSRLVLAIFWFNPLVWRLHASLAERSEEAADAVAVGSVDRTFYARTLVRLASAPAPFAATAMAADAKTLKTRIARLMTQTADRRRPVTVALTIAALALVAAPLAAFGLNRQAAPPVPPAPPAATADIPATPLAPPTPEPARSAAPAAPPAPPVPPVSAKDLSDIDVDVAQAVAEARTQAALARVQADQARLNADELRRIAEDASRQVAAHRGEIEAARQAAQQSRLSAEEARRIGEQARVEAMKLARIQMEKAPGQMRDGARQMREEAARLHDPAYRARRIEENRARGQTVTDQELQDVARKLPRQADDLDREADKLAEKARDMS